MSSLNSNFIIAGVDEAGRGPLAGAVVAAAVILDYKNKIMGLTDSKKLSAKKREFLATEIKKKSICWSIAAVNEKIIDKINILQASLMAMKIAVEKLTIQPHKILVDGVHIPEVQMQAVAIIKGDLTEPAISAASIIAKVHRDNLMMDIHRQYPLYGFDKHKGYPTKNHLLTLQKYGVCPHHRKTFKPVKNILTNL
ncbi:MAG: ribonuclease HII [Gammaproteobacteria bacterium]|nr:MAG: ribonuclease HII [Gammaproteobacteria bacterium]